MSTTERTKRLINVVLLDFVESCGFKKKTAQHKGVGKVFLESLTILRVGTCWRCLWCRTFISWPSAETN